MNAEQFIRDCAHRGLSKTQTLEALGWSREKFYTALEYLPALPWPTRGKGLGRKQSDEARRGHCPPALRAALAESRARRKAKHSHTLRGTTGTIEELLLIHACQVSASTIRRRLAKGWTLETAFFDPPEKAFKNHHATHAWH
jgi:hypothetical protein